MSKVFSLWVIIFSLISIGCGHVKTRKDLQGSQVSPDPVEQTQVESEKKDPESIALILGPGSLRTLSHAGVLETLERNKVPIHSISGVEWGAMIAGFYAVSGSATKLQWELQKIKGSVIPSAGFMSKKIESKEVDSFLKKVLSSSVLNSRVERANIEFSCSASDTMSGRNRILISGRLSSVLNSCMPIDPLLTTKSQSVAGLFQIEELIERQMKQPVKSVVYVNVLSSKDLFDGAEMVNNKLDAFLWSQARQLHLRKLAELKQKYDRLIVLDVDNSGQTLFKNKNSNMLFLSGKRAGKHLINQLGL